MSKLISYLKNYKKGLILGPIFKLTEAVFELIAPVVMALIIDKGIPSGDISYCVAMGGVVLLLYVSGFAFSITCQYMASRVSQGYGTTLRNEVYKKINSFSDAEMDRFGASSLITRTTNDINQLQHAVAMLIRLVIRAPLLAIGSIVLAFVINAKISLIFVVSTLLASAVTWFVAKKTVPYFKGLQARLDRVSLLSKESLEGVRVIRAFSKEDYEIEKFSRSADEVADISVRAGKITALLNPLTYLVMNTAAVCILWFGSFEITAGSISAGQIVALINYLSQTLLGINIVSMLINIYTKAYASAKRVEDVLETEPSIVYPAERHECHSLSDTAFEFRNVSFSYSESSKKQLENISFKIKKGGRLGIIGTTGSGKTTLVKLLMRKYDCDSGSILIFGRNIREYTQSELVSIFGYVPQRSALFSGTIRQNMQLKDPEASDEEINAALKTAVADGFVGSMKAGLDTFVSQDGKNLSGGQKQRIAIARALVGKPDILVFDDSSSALDYKTEAALRQNLSALEGSPTVVTISQRASAVKNCDLIIVLSQGAVSGIGTHEELQSSCEEYAELCRLQKLIS